MSGQVGVSSVVSVDAGGNISNTLSSELSLGGGSTQTSSVTSGTEASATASVSSVNTVSESGEITDTIQVAISHGGGSSETSQAISGVNAVATVNVSSDNSITTAGAISDTLTVEIVHSGGSVDSSSWNATGTNATGSFSVTATNTVGSDGTITTAWAKDDQIVGTGGGGGGGASEPPMSDTLVGGLQLLYAASSLSGSYSDGDLITTWNDTAGSNWNAAGKSVGAGNYPKYVSGIFGSADDVGCASFYGAASDHGYFYASANEPPSGITDMTVFMTVQTASANATTMEDYTICQVRAVSGYNMCNTVEWDADPLKNLIKLHTTTSAYETAPYKMAGNDKAVIAYRVENTASGADVSIWVNQYQVSSNVAASSIGTNACWTFGDMLNPMNSLKTFKGYIADFRVYDTALDASDVEAKISELDDYYGVTYWDSTVGVNPSGATNIEGSWIVGELTGYSDGSYVSSLIDAQGSRNLSNIYDEGFNTGNAIYRTNVKNGHPGLDFTAGGLYTNTSPGLGTTAKCVVLALMIPTTPTNTNQGNIVTDASYQMGMFIAEDYTTDQWAVGVSNYDNLTNQLMCQIQDAENYTVTDGVFYDFIIVVCDMASTGGSSAGTTTTQIWINGNKAVEDANIQGNDSYSPRVSIGGGLDKFVTQPMILLEAHYFKADKSDTAITNISNHLLEKYGIN